MLQGGWENLRYPLIMICFTISTFVLFPYTLFYAFGTLVDWMYLMAAYGVALVGILYLAVKGFREDSIIRKQRRQWFREQEAVFDGTYRCVSPQVLNNIVVFPILVSSRVASHDQIVELQNDKLVVALAQGGSVGPPVGGFGKQYEEGMRQRQVVMQQRAQDTEARLKALLGRAIANPNVHFDIRIFSGTGGGPTGLSAAVSHPDYGSTLAAYVGTSLESHAVKTVAPPPLCSIGGDGVSTKSE